MSERPRPPEPTAELPKHPAEPSAYHRGVAQVGPAAARRGRARDDTREYREPHTRTIDSDPRADDPPPAPARWAARLIDRPPPPPTSRHQRLRRLRRGGEWSTVGALVAFVCWGSWAISARGGDLTVPFLAFVLVLLVGAGLFAICRLLGRIVLERGLGRQRRSAWPSHLAVGAYLAVAGVFYLGQIQWVVDAWTWLRTLR